MAGQNPDALDKTGNVPAYDAAAITLQNLRNAYRELVSGSSYQPYLDLKRSLPRYSDDVERDFGLRIYDDMMNDASVNAALWTLWDMVDDGEPNVVPAVSARLAASEDERRMAKRAQEVCDIVRYAIADCEESFHDSVIQLGQGAMVKGARLAEMVFEPKLGSWQGQRVRKLRALDIKEPDTYRYIVDRNGRWLALQAIIPGVGLALVEGMVGDPQAWPNTISPEKFCHVQMRGLRRDPRGRSLLRPAYNAWWLKRQTWPQLLKWLSQWASPSLLAFLDKDAAPTDDGTPPEEIVALTLEKVQSGSVGALRGGMSAMLLQASGEGGQFWSSLDGYDRQIFTAVLGQGRTNKEAEHGSKADSSTGMTIVERRANRIRGVVARAIRSQVFRLIVRINCGEEDAALFTPRYQFSSASATNWAEEAKATAVLLREVTNPLQRQELLERLGLTPQMLEGNVSEGLAEDEEAESEEDGEED